MNVGVLTSHDGTTLQSLLDAFSGGRIQGRVAVVVSNNGDALDAAIRAVLIAADVDVVFLAGYMKKLGPLVLGLVETFGQIATGEIRVAAGPG